MNPHTTIDVALLDLVGSGTSGAPVLATAQTVQESLQSQIPDVTWSVRVVSADPPRSSPPHRSRRAVAVLTQARSTLLALDVDVVVALTDSPLSFRGHPVTSHTSPVQQTAALYVPPSLTGDDVVPDPSGAPTSTVTSAADAIVALLLQLLGADEDPDADTGAVLRAMGSATASSAPHGEATRRSRRGDGARERRGLGRRRVGVVVDTVRLVATQVVAARPWLLALHLSRTLLGASAAALVAVVTPDFWLLADRMGAGRLAVVMFFVLVAGVAVLAIGGNLLERQPQVRRRDVTVHNAVVWMSVSIGVLTLLVGIAVINLAVTLVVLPRSLVAETVGHAASWGTMAEVCALTAAVSLLGSVLGAGLEDDADVQDAAYGNSDDVRYAEPHTNTLGPDEGVE